MKQTVSLLSLAFVLAFTSCTTDDSAFIVAHQDGDGLISLHLPEEPFIYEFEDRTTPGYVKGSEKILITNERATLGRVLFYDRTLSVDDKVSCGSCHQQDKGFADNEQFSKGAFHNKATRNTLPLTNLSARASYFWDGRSDSLQEAVLLPFTNPDEMGLSSMDEVVGKVGLRAVYKDLFRDAFGTTEITKERTADALAAFVASIPNMKSKRDKVYFGWEVFTASEERGYRAFHKFRCGSCHYGMNTGGDGIGRASIGAFSDSKDPGMNGEFLIPSLRNVNLTAPYMHDGSLQTLEEVLDFYRSDDLEFNSTEARTSIIIKGYRNELKDITDQEAEDIIAFLKTYSDMEVADDVRFSNPFY
jgi:cytochrome c peroxidase